jgi:hypothetical protein
MPKEILEWLESHFGAGPIVLVLAAVALWVVYKFFVQSVQNAAQKYYEFKLELCQEAANISAKISTSNDPNEIRKSVARFDELYWGDLVLVEDVRLEIAMVEFRKLIPRGGHELDAEQLVTKMPDRKELQRAALKISSACFNMLQPRWFDMIISSFRTRHKM